MEIRSAFPFPLAILFIQQTSGDLPSVRKGLRNACADDILRLHFRFIIKILILPSYTVLSLSHGHLTHHERPDLKASLDALLRATDPFRALKLLGKTSSFAYKCKHTLHTRFLAPPLGFMLMLDIEWVVQYAASAVALDVSV